MDALGDNRQHPRHQLLSPSRKVMDWEGWGRSQSLGNLHNRAQGETPLSWLWGGPRPPPTRNAGSDGRVRIASA